MGEDASFSKEPDMEHLIIDSTTCASLWRVPRIKRGTAVAGSFSTKVHVSVDALGNPEIQLTEGQAHEAMN